MKTVCPNCSQEVEIPNTAAGAAIPCPACGASFAPEEPKICQNCGALNHKDAAKCEKCGKTILSINISKPAAGGPPKLNISIPKPAEAPAGGPPKLNLATPKPAEAPAGGPPKLNISMPKPAEAPAGGPPKLNLATSKLAGAPVGKPPKLNLATPKPAEAPAGKPPKLNLSIPNPAPAAQANAEDRSSGTGKQESEGKEPPCGGAKKSRVLVAAVLIILLLGAAGAAVYFTMGSSLDPKELLNEAKKSLEAGDTKNAVPLLEKAAKQGNHHAAALLGDLYLKGEGVTEDLSKAISLFRSAENDPLAHFRLGQLYAEGKGLDKDPAEAIKHFEIAAKGGHSDAEVEYARFYAEGIGVKKDERKAVPWRKKLADEGNPEAQLDMAKYHINGVFTDYSPADAVRYLSLAAKQGNRTARYLLAAYTMKGIGTKKDEKNAQTDFARLYQEISQTPDGKTNDADLIIAAKCLIGGYGVKTPDPARAEELLAGPAERKDPEAVMLLYTLTKDEAKKSALLEKGLALNIPLAKEITALQNAKTDPAKAERLLKEAQDQGSVSAFAAAAAIHLEKEPERAFEEARYACKRGDPLGSLICAGCLETGRGTEKDLEQAFEIYWDLASHPSSVQAQAHARLMDLFGKKESREALTKRLQDQLENGTPEKKQAVRKMEAGLYLAGIGVPKNTSKAVDCLWKAQATDELIQLLENGIESKKILALCLKENNVRDPELFYTLAKLLFTGEKGVPAAPSTGAAFLKKAAAANHPQAAYELGCLYEQEKACDLPDSGKDSPEANIEKSSSEAMKYFRQAAESGHPEAQYRYARALCHAKQLPEGIEDKNAEAGIWLKKAVQSGYAPAFFLYAMIRLDSGSTAKSEYPEIFSMIRRAAEAGYTPAMFALGDIAAAAKKKEEADAWHEKAAEEKFVPALILLKRAKKNSDRIGEAAAAGYIPAQAEEALALLKKERKDKSLKRGEAERKLEHLCSLGYCAGRNELGVAAYEKNKRTALKIFKKAASEGSACALFNLGAYTYREENLGAGNYQNVKAIFEELRTTRPDFKRIPAGLEKDLDRRMKLESEFRKLIAEHKELVKNLKQKSSSPEMQKDIEKSERNIEKKRNELDSVTASLKKKLNWILESDYSDYFRKAPPKFRYPWAPAPDLSPLKSVYK